MLDTPLSRTPLSIEETFIQRIWAETKQALAVTVKDVRIYYLKPPMIMFGLLMPFFMFFSFSVGRGLDPASSLAKLLALTSFFTASSAGPVILPLERATRTFDRLLVAPVSLMSVLLGKSLVGAFFGLAVSLVPLAGSILLYGVGIANVPLLVVGLLGGSFAFSVLGVLLASVPADTPGAVMMPSTLLRWPLLFISGVFVPLESMQLWTRVLSYLSPLTYTQDLLSYAVQGVGVQGIGLDLLALLVSLAVFLFATLKLQGLSRRLGQ